MYFVKIMNFKARYIDLFFFTFSGKTSQDILTMDDSIGGVEDPFGQK